MRVNYLSLDRPDLSFAAGALARGMKSPTTKDFEELKRVGRYLRGRPVGAIVFEPPTLLVVTLDKEWERGAEHQSKAKERGAEALSSALCRSY